MDGDIDSFTILTVLDGVTLATVMLNSDDVWCITDGALDQNSVDKIGNAIDNHFF